MAEDHHQKPKCPNTSAVEAPGIATGQTSGVQKGVPAEILIKQRASATRGGDPVFPGARHDADGYCVAHPKVRLSEPVFAEDAKGDASPTKYRPVRKICPQCGLHPPAQTLGSVRRLSSQENGKEHGPNSRKEQSAKEVPKKTIEGACAVLSGTHGPKSQGPQLTEKDNKTLKIEKGEGTGLAKSRDGGKEKNLKSDENALNVEQEKGRDKGAVKVKDDSKVKFVKKGSTLDTDREKGVEKDASKDDEKEKTRERGENKPNVEKEKERDKNIARTKDDGKDKHLKRENMSNADREKHKNIGKVKDEVREKTLRREHTLDIDREKGREKDAPKPKDDGKEKTQKKHESSGDKDKGKNKDAARVEVHGKVKKLDRVSESKIEKERGRDKDIDVAKDDEEERRLKRDGNTSNIGREKTREKDEAKINDDGGKNPKSNLVSRSGRQYSLQQSRSKEPNSVREAGGPNHTKKKTHDSHSLQHGHSKHNSVNLRAGHQYSLQHGHSKNVNAGLCIGRQYSLQHDQSKRHGSGKEFIDAKAKGECNHPKKKKDHDSLTDPHHSLQHGRSKHRNSKELSRVDEEGGSHHLKKQLDGNMRIPKIPINEVKFTRSGGQPGKIITEERDTDNENGPAAGASGISPDRKGTRRDKDTREINAKEKDLLLYNQHRTKSLEVKGQRTLQRSSCGSHRLKKSTSDISWKRDAAEPKERRSSINKDDKKECQKSSCDIIPGKVGFAKTPPDRHNKSRDSSNRKDVRKDTDKAAEHSRSRDPDSRDTKQHFVKNKNEVYKSKGSRGNHAMKPRSSRGRSNNKVRHRSLSAERGRKRDRADRNNKDHKQRHYQRSKTLDVPRRQRACSPEHHPSNLSIYRQEFYKEVAQLGIDPN